MAMMLIVLQFISVYYYNFSQYEIKLLVLVPTVWLLPLVAEVSLTLLLTSDHPADIADVVLHHLTNDDVVEMFSTW